MVFVRSQSVWSAYGKLRIEKSFGADPNLWQGAFELGSSTTGGPVYAAPSRRKRG